MIYTYAHSVFLWSIVPLSNFSQLLFMHLFIYLFIYSVIYYTYLLSVSYSANYLFIILPIELYLIDLY